MSYVSDVKLVRGEDVACPTGYTHVGRNNQTYDLTRWKNDAVYLCAKRGAAATYADLKFANDKCPEGYSAVGDKLGKFSYLCAKEVASPDEDAITDMRFVEGNETCPTNLWRRDEDPANKGRFLCKQMASSSYAVPGGGGGGADDESDGADGADDESFLGKYKWPLVIGIVLVAVCLLSGGGMVAMMAMM